MFDLSGVQENAAIPNGSYSVIINKAEIKPTKTGGEMINVQMKVLDGQPQGGRVIFSSFNVKNANPQAVQIGLSQLKTCLKSFGHANPNMLKSVDELVGLKGIVTTKIQADEGYGEQARVTSYKPLTQNAAAPLAGPVAPGATPQGANPF